MVELESDYSKEELISRRDEYTSAARFAGSDETLDLIFVSKRNGDRIKFIRKSNSVHEPYAAVFHGKISGEGGRSCIKDIFTKSVLDYIFTALITLWLLSSASMPSRAAPRCILPTLYLPPL